MSLVLGVVLLVPAAGGLVWLWWSGRRGGGGSDRREEEEVGPSVEQLTKAAKKPVHDPNYESITDLFDGDDSKLPNLSVTNTPPWALTPTSAPSPSTAGTQPVSESGSDDTVKSAKVDAIKAGKVIKGKDPQYMTLTALNDDILGAPEAPVAPPTPSPASKKRKSK